MKCESLRQKQFVRKRESLSDSVHGSDYYQTRAACVSWIITVIITLNRKAALLRERVLSHSNPQP